MTDDEGSRRAGNDDRTAADRERRPTGSPENDPDEWATGDEAMTGPQASYLETLSREAGERSIRR